MKSNNLQEAMASFLASNPDLPHGENIEEKRIAPKKKIKLNIAIEKKGRNGKTATIIYGLSQLPQSDIVDLERYIKKRLGVGGSSRGDEILIQGNLGEKVRDILTEMGYRI